MQTVHTYGLSAAQWFAVLRIGLGLWWLESWRHKDKKGWLQRSSGIEWARGVASRHRWAFVRDSFDRVVAPRPRLMAYVVVLAELALGLGSPSVCSARSRWRPGCCSTSCTSC